MTTTGYNLMVNIYIPFILSLFWTYRQLDRRRYVILPKSHETLHHLVGIEIEIEICKVIFSLHSNKRIARCFGHVDKMI